MSTHSLSTLATEHRNKCMSEKRRRQGAPTQTTIVKYLNGCDLDFCVG